VPGDELRVQRGSVLTGEVQATVHVGLTPRGSFGCLGELVSNQRPNRPLVEVDAAMLPTRGLGPRNRCLVAELHDLLADDEKPALEIDVGPSQPDRFTAPQARHRDQLVQGAEPVSYRVIKEPAQLSRLPRLGPASRHLGSSTCTAGLTMIRCCFTAAFNADRSVACTRRAVTGPTRPLRDSGKHRSDVGGAKPLQGMLPS